MCHVTQGIKYLVFFQAFLYISVIFPFFSFFFTLKYIRFAVLCQFLGYSKVIQLCTCIYSFSDSFPLQVIIQTMVPCAIQYILLYLFLVLNHQRKHQSLTKHYILKGTYIFKYQVQCQILASLVAQSERICLQCRRLGFPSLSLEDPLEKKMATHFSILA